MSLKRAAIGIASVLFVSTTLSGCLFETTGVEEDLSINDRDPNAPSTQEDDRDGGRDEALLSASQRLLTQLQFISPFEVDICAAGEGGTAVALIFETVFDGQFTPGFGEFIVNDANRDGRGDDVRCNEPALPLAPRVAVFQDRLIYRSNQSATLTYVPNLDDGQTFQIEWSVDGGDFQRQAPGVTTFTIPDVGVGNRVLNVVARLLIDGQLPDASDFQDPENLVETFQLRVEQNLLSNALQAVFLPNGRAAPLPQQIVIPPAAQQPKGNLQGGIVNATAPAQNGNPPEPAALSGFTALLGTKLGVDVTNGGQVQTANTADQVASAQTKIIESQVGIASSGAGKVTNQGSVSPAANVILTKLGVDLAANASAKAGTDMMVTATELSNCLLRTFIPQARFDGSAGQKSQKTTDNEASTSTNPCAPDNIRPPGNGQNAKGMALNGQIRDRRFVIYIGTRVLGNSGGETFTTMLVVREGQDDVLSLLAEDARDPTLLMGKDQLLATRDEVNTFNGFPLGTADFLFAIDNSGSMGDEQAALALAVDEFIEEVAGSGLDFRVGAITTDSDQLRRGHYFPTDTAINVLRDILQPGTNGNFVESAIFFSERSLFDTRFGDEIDGTSTSNVTNFGFVSGLSNGANNSKSLVPEPIPRRDPIMDSRFLPGTGSIQVVMVSDEPDQYQRFASRPFDPANNLFVEGGYTVHTIIDPDFEASDRRNNANGSQYSELTRATGGLTADIRDQEAFEDLMEDIVRFAAGQASGLVLTFTDPATNEELDPSTRQVIPASINVKVNNQPIARNRENGFDFNAANRSISLFGSAIPQDRDNAVIEVNFRHRPRG